MIEIRIANETEYLLITVQNYSYPSATDFYDGNWLNTYLELQVGTFKCKTNASLRTDELAGFHQDLKQVFDELRGSAVFVPMEPWVNLNVHVNEQGHFIVKGSMKDDLSKANTLEFEIKTDPSYIKKTLEALKQSTDRFPVRRQE